MKPPSQPDRDEIWRQMLEYLEGTLPDAQAGALNDRLKADGELRAIFADLLVQQLKLQEMAEEAAAMVDVAGDGDAVSWDHAAPHDTAMAPVNGDRSTCPPLPGRTVTVTTLPHRVRPSRYATGLALAATILLLAALAWFWIQPPRMARIDLVEGTVILHRNGRPQVAQPAQLLREGDGLQTTDGSHLLFTFLNEETEISMRDGTDLQLGRSGESRLLVLATGALEAVVAKQKPGRPLRLRTPQAEAIVVGTRFRMTASDTTTRLEVFEGAVQIAPEAGDPPLLVSSGYGTTVTPGLPATLQQLANTRGTILLESWDDSGGTTNQTQLGQLMFSGSEARPGSSRVRGYLHPPRSGAYSLQVSANGPAELWLSDSDDPAHARRVWQSGTATGDAGSDVVVEQLQAGTRRYLELRCRSTEHAPAFTLSWTMPGGIKRVIYGEYLSPYASPPPNPSGR